MIDCLQSTNADLDASDRAEIDEAQQEHRYTAPAPDLGAESAAEYALAMEARRVAWVARKRAAEERLRSD